MPVKSTKDLELTQGERVTRGEGGSQGDVSFKGK